MKKLMFLVCFLTNIFNSTSQINILAKNETYISPKQDMVVMDKYTFAQYHYTAEQYDSLKIEMQKYDSTVEWVNSECKEMEQGYKNLIVTKDKQIQDYSHGYSSLKTTLKQSIEEQNRLQLSYQKLENKQKRVKKWRNIFLGTSALLGGIIVLIIVH